MDGNRHEVKQGKHGKIMKRSKKRHSAENEKKSAKCDDTRDKSNAGVPQGESSLEPLQGAVNEGGTEGASGDNSNSETLSFNLILGMILNQKKQELLECPEVLQLLQQTSRNP